MVIVNIFPTLPLLHQWHCGRHTHVSEVDPNAFSVSVPVILETINAKGWGVDLQEYFPSRVDPALLRTAVRTRRLLHPTHHLPHRNSVDVPHLTDQRITIVLRQSQTVWLPCISKHTVVTSSSIHSTTHISREPDLARVAP